MTRLQAETDRFEQIPEMSCRRPAVESRSSTIINKTTSSTDVVVRAKALQQRPRRRRPPSLMGLVFIRTIACHMQTLALSLLYIQLHIHVYSLYICTHINIYTYAAYA